MIKIIMKEIVFKKQSFFSGKAPLIPSRKCLSFKLNIVYSFTKKTDSIYFLIFFKNNKIAGLEKPAYEILF